MKILDDLYKKYKLEKKDKYNQTIKNRRINTNSDKYYKGGENDSINGSVNNSINGSVNNSINGGNIVGGSINNNDTFNNIQINTELPNQLQKNDELKYENVREKFIIKQTPPYGCLKSGKKPTYRNWLRNKRGTVSKQQKKEETIREKVLKKIRHEIKKKQDEIDKAKILEHQQHKNKIAIDKLIDNERKNIKKYNKYIKTLKRKTTKKTYKLGKKGNKKISVLIKNKKTRRKIQNERLLLRKTPIAEIKNSLINKGLLKYGSIAPNDVLRELYEKAILTGELYNKSNSVLMHNYISKRD